MDTKDDSAHVAAGGLGAVLAATARRLGHAPLLTYYDDVAGNRTELSYATFDNWVSKTANLLAEELRAARGTRVAVAVLDDWISAVMLFAAWRVGAVVVPGLVGDADVLVVAEAEAEAEQWADHPALVVVGGGFGGRVVGQVPGLPYGDEVLAFADYFEDAAGPADAAFTAADASWSHADLLQAGAVHNAAAGRVLSTTALGSAESIATTLVAPLVGGGSVVWCPRAAGVDLRARAAAEHATHRVAADELRPLE